MTAIDKKTWDIFCRVIDNYGDIGVCWRLARQLAIEHPVRVRLWVDEIDSLIHIWPETARVEQQIIENVDVRIWHQDFDQNILPADVIIEAFACNLPDSYLTAMKNEIVSPRWFNLDYLSAEKWVEGCHGLLSTHPQLGLKKMFFFPGFTPKTGGVLKEKSLLIDQKSFLSDPTNPRQFLKKLGVRAQNNELIISLFGYENNAVASLLSSWENSQTPILCLVPPSKILTSITFCLGKHLKVGDEFEQGSLRLKVIPFLTQTDYDMLLWSCDLNFIRGEDSFVRAQWAAKPFVWHIYPQDDDAHIIKLDAFLNLYLDHADPELKSSVSTLWHQWNRAEPCDQSWNLCLENLPAWQKHSQDWCLRLDSQTDLVSNFIASAQ